MQNNLGENQSDQSVTHSRLTILGPFRLIGPNNERIAVKSKKGQALIATLAVAGGGERTRSWLQDKLWGSRQQSQAQASLRNELAALRGVLNTATRPLIDADHLRVWIDLTQIQVDAREIEFQTDAPGEFLEGLDIAGEEGFEDWLREERARISNLRVRIDEEAPPPKSDAPMASIAPSEFAKLPALAVRPFANLTNDPAHDYLAEGISEDLIDRLSRLRWLPIIARSTSFAEPSANGDNAGARYLLDGRLRTEGMHISLSDTETGQILWSNKLLIDDSSPNALGDILSGLASTLGAQVDQKEQAIALRKSQSDLNVRDLIWRGRWHLNRLTKEDSDKAKACFAEALAREPNSSEAIIQHAWALLWDAWANRGNLAEIKTIRKLAQNAIMADLDDARGHMLAGIAECWMRQPVRAEALLRRAITLNPSLVLAHAQLGSVLLSKNHPSEAIESLNAAIRLSPNDQDIFYTMSELACAYLVSGNYAQAILNADDALMRRPAYWHAHIVKINALARNGEKDAAQIALKELQASKAKFDASFIDWLPFVDPKWNDFLKEGLNQVTAEYD
jgi:TolB-like protein/DNA-binding SARP family transcriptional activator